MGCKKLEEEINMLKISYEKLWLALITTAGGLGTLIVKGVNNYSYLIVLTSLLLISEIIGIFLIHLKVLKLAEILEDCEGEENGNSS